MVLNWETADVGFFEAHCGDAKEAGSGRLIILFANLATVHLHICLCTRYIL